MRNKFIIYQVLPRLFGNLNENCTPGGTFEENGCGKFSAFSPKILRSIKKLGCTHIWITGVLEQATCTSFPELSLEGDNPCIVKGQAGSPYAIKDYYDISPELSDHPELRMEEFKNLISLANTEGLDIIIDFVPNHLSRAYKSDSKPNYIDDFGAKDNPTLSFSAGNNFYYIPGKPFVSPASRNIPCGKYKEFPAKVTGNDCFRADPDISDWYETVKLNYGVDYLNGGEKHFSPVPDTWLKMADILEFWAQKGISGFRCDMAEMVPIEFWRKVIIDLKEKYPQIMFIGEIYKTERYREFVEAGFDYLYDKSGLYDTLRLVLKGEISASSITPCWQMLGDLQGRMLNFLENHDEHRIASDFFLSDPSKAISALAVSLLMNSSPFMIYFGQELGERGMDSEGFSRLDGKTSIFDYWSVSTVREWIKQGKEPPLRGIYSKLMNLALSEKAFSRGKFYDLQYFNTNNPDYHPYHHYSFLRGERTDLILVVVNFSQSNFFISVNIPQEAFAYFHTEYNYPIFGVELLDGDKILISNAKGEFEKFEIAANGIRIIKLLQ